ncbi:MAG: GNAT family N-acetyltransferase [Acidimicrobiia bacterium]
MTHLERHHEEYLISTDPALLDIEVIHRWISEKSYWAAGRSRPTVEASVANSLNFGVYTKSGELVGAARVVTDGATFGWLCDFFVLAEHRGRGLGKALMEAVVDHPDLRTLQRLILATADAHGLYERYGFEVMAHPERWMEKEGPIS